MQPNQPTMVFQQPQMVMQGSEPQIYIPFNSLKNFQERNLETKTFVFLKMPTTVEEFIEERNKHGNSPHGGAALFTLAMIIWSHDKVLGMKCITITTDMKYVEDNSEEDSYKNKRLCRSEHKNFYYRISSYKKEYLCRSYIYGNNNPTPENQYSFDPTKPFGIGTYRQSIDVEGESGKVRMFVMCTGALPRPLHVQRNNRGIYKASNWSSLQIGTRFVKPVEDDDL